MTDKNYTSNNGQASVTQTSAGTPTIANQQSYLVIEKPPYKTFKGIAVEQGAEEVDESFMEAVSKINYKTILRQIP